MKSSLLLVSSLTALTFAAPSFAQNVPRFMFNFGGGFTEPVRSTGSQLDVGWNANAGAGINLMSHLGVMGEFGFNDSGLSSAALDAAGVPGGTMRVYSVTGDALIRLNPKGRFDAYVIGGPGWYRRTVEFTAPTTSLVTVFDPFLGFFDVGVPANQVLGSMTVDKPGWNVGGGVTWRLSENSHAKLYAEARYHYIYTDNVRTTLLPVTFGIRW